MTSVAIILRKSVFIHIPKTGGNWVEEVLRSANLIVHNTRAIGRPHAGLADLPALGHAVTHLQSFAFVRHPAAWWRSYWTFKIQNGWDEPNELDRTCRDASFDGFIRKVLERYPNFHAAHFRSYTKGVTYVGRMESLADDLMQILLKLGEPFDADLIRMTAPANTSPSRTVSYAPELLSALLESEKEAIEEWGYGLHGYGRV